MTTRPLHEAPDNPGFWEKWRTGEWEPQTKAILDQYLTPGSTFVDIGAWIGPVSLWALELGASVVAYEPDEVAADLYVLNLSGLDNWKLHKVAVSDTVGWGNLASWGHQDDGEYGNSMSRLSPRGKKVETVDPATVLSEAPDPALIKIDVEGGELDILPQLLSLVRCPILVVWHQDYWDTGLHVDLKGWDFRGPIGGFGQSLLLPA